MKLNQNEFNMAVAKNLVMYRKYNKYTQLALAEKLNYSDKAVSKWESGECLPDAYVLSTIAELYGITLNDLITPRNKPKPPANKTKAIFIPLLSICLVWMVALLSFISIKAFIPWYDNPAIVMLFALPISFIVLVIFSCIYKVYIMQFVSISALIWTTILTMHVVLVKIFSSIRLLYLFGIPLQIAVILWYSYKYIKLIKQRK